MMKPRLQDVYRLLMRLVLRHPLSMLGVAMLGVLLSLLLTVTHLEFHTDRLDLVSSGNRYKQLDQLYSREFEEVAQGVVVVIRSPDPERAKSFATALATRWQADPTIEQVLYRIPFETLQDKAMFYLSPEALEALREKLQQSQGMLEEFVAQPTLQNLFSVINREITRALVGHMFTDFLANDEGQASALDLSVVGALLRQLHARLNRPDVAQAPWDAVFTFDPDSAPQDGFLWSDDRQLLFVLATPKADTGDFDQYRRAAQRIRQDLKDLQHTYPDIEVGLTGGDILESDEMAAAQRDMGVATLLSLAGVACLFVVFFKGVMRPTLAVITLLIGIVWSLGLTTLAVGHLNIFTIVFAPMLIGLGIDYGIHFTTRYEAERRGGENVESALLNTYRGTGTGIVTAALTTAVAFYALAFTDFLGLRELGVITGSGLLLILLATFTVLPALLVLDERWRGGRVVERVERTRGKDEAYLEPLYRYPWATLAASLCFAGLSLLALGKVDTDFNLLRLQSAETESVVWAQRIFESSKRSVLVAELMAGSLDEVERKVAALSRLASVEKVDSLLAVLPQDQERKRPLITALQPLLVDMTGPQDVPESIDLEAFRDTLQRLDAKLVGDDETAEPAAGDAVGQAHEAHRLITAVLHRMEGMGKAAAEQALLAFQRDVREDLAAKLALLQRNLQAEPVTLADLPSELQTRYVGKTGKYRLFVFPAEDVWDYPALARFVEDLQAVDRDAIGAPVTNYEYIQAIKEGYEKAGLYALCGILLLSFLTFRGAQPTLLAMVPLGVGAVWTLGLMALFNVSFNMANLLFIPLIIGMGIDNGVHIVHRYLDARRHAEQRIPLPRSTGKAVTLSTLTTIVGFGSLMVSQHHGIYSLGLLVTLGVGSVLVASLTTLPSLLALLGSGRQESVPMPATSRKTSRLKHLLGEGRPS
ncbi:MAG TPA: MMPL family transporter [Alphaproteobacteria bacterium]|nr:MMPL family transporter [Alphaproteobacteria bacterium]